MSYQIVISGHHDDDNQGVKQVAEEAVEKLRALGHRDLSLSGFSYNGPERISLSTPPLPPEQATAQTGQGEHPQPSGRGSIGDR